MKSRFPDFRARRCSETGGQRWKVEVEVPVPKAFYVIVLLLKQSTGALLEPGIWCTSSHFLDNLPEAMHFGIAC